MKNKVVNFAGVMISQIREYSDAGSKVYVKMPINGCNKCGYVQQALRSEEGILQPILQQNIC